MSPEEQLLLMAEEIVNQLGPEAALSLSGTITYMAGKEPMRQEQKTPEYARRNRKLIKK